MNITVEFKSLEEIKDFAREILGVEVTGAKADVKAPVVPAPCAMPQTGQAAVVPVTYAPAASPTQVPVAPVQPPVRSVPATFVQPPVSVPTTTSNYTPDDLARAAMALMDSGRQAELQQLLATFGVESLPALQPTQYGAFATALRGMGAQI